MSLMKSKERLHQILKRSDTVLFIGSGISTWSGLPTWTQTIDQLAQFLEDRDLDPDSVRKELDRDELIQAASFGLHQLTDHQFAEFISTLGLIGIASPS